MFTHRNTVHMMSEAMIAAMDYIEAHNAFFIARDLRDSSNASRESFDIAVGWQHEEIHNMDKAFERFIPVYNFFLSEYKQNNRSYYVNRLEAMLKDMGLK